MFGVLRHGYAICVMCHVLVRRMFCIRHRMFGFRLRFLYRHQRHSAFRTLARFSADDLGMHRTSVELLRTVVFVLRERDAGDGQRQRT